MARKFTINAVGNERTRSYDLHVTYNSGEISIYRTGKLSPEEFEDAEYNTERDWINFLNTDQSYYVVSKPKNTELVTKQQFMDFFRSAEGYDQLTPDDAVEIFSSVLRGSSDFTKELLDKVLSDYGVVNLKVVEV